ncbi:hypothetical protein MNV49_007938 [Pseudohyphozyma bogoriensis]|nr:hypothetical protein MNV49_007938 [Pseudohyphozyma bogoriensis]
MLDTGVHHHRVNVDDDLIFGDFCFSKADSSRLAPKPATAAASPEYSPILCGVPGLVHSAKSTCSSPPSSSSNSPSPPSGMMADLSVGDEPPALDLPASVHKLHHFGAASLPLGALPTAINFALSYGQDYSRENEIKSASLGSTDGFEDLQFRRKPGKPAHQVPAPLYFRHTASHNSPALTPSSPALSTLSPLFGVARPPSLANVSTFALPPSEAPPSAPAPDSAMPAQNRRSSWAHPSQPRRSNVMDSPDVLLSPRIRALRAADGDAGIIEETDASAAAPETESAFANYLFSHLDSSAVDEPIPQVDAHGPRGRQAAGPITSVEAMQRSVSADSVASQPPRAPSLGPGRPSRFLFSRGNAASAASTQDENIAPLIPGHLIGATSGSFSSSAAASPMSTSPSSPPTGRGRSSTRQTATSSSSFEPASVDPRGRSKLRGLVRPRDGEGSSAIEVIGSGRA